MSGHSFHPSALRAYDIRGIVDHTLTETDMLILGKAFGTRTRRGGGQRVSVAYDGRLSSPRLEQALVDGLLSTGITVERLGLSTTPMLCFASRLLETDGGMIVTGSHNPPEYNGVKIIDRHAPFYGEHLLQLQERALSQDFDQAQGQEKSIEIQSAYLDHLLRHFPSLPSLKVAWDGGNGAIGCVLADLTAQLTGRHHRLYDVVDGSFPHHHPDPTREECLTDLKRYVVAHECDLGIAFDGDGDRIGVVDQDGESLFGDQLMTLYVQDLVPSHPRRPIIADVKSSQTLFDEIARLGGVPVMWKTGHSLIKAKMKELDSPLAGEMSGHIFFKDWGDVDDALYNALRLLTILGKTDSSLGALRQRLPTLFHTPEIRIHIAEDHKYQLIQQIKTQISLDPQTQIIDIDGMRVISEQGWWLLRASNTQDMITLRVEGYTQSALESLLETVGRHLDRNGLSSACLAPL